MNGGKGGQGESGGRGKGEGGRRKEEGGRRKGGGKGREGKGREGARERWLLPHFSDESASTDRTTISNVGDSWCGAIVNARHL